MPRGYLWAVSRHIAAVDLGSNSFHMLVARVAEDGSVRVVDRLKERVRLAAGLDENGVLSAESQDRALACLDRFGDRLRELPRGDVRAIGTNTLRRAANGHTFLIRAKRALGHPIDVVSGREEARLIHLGVAGEFVEPARRLLIDIGGGSTELILGDREPERLDSVAMGCVSWTRRFFPQGEVTKAALQAAITAARLELDLVARGYRGAGWVQCVGSSGTIRSVAKALAELGQGEITPDGLRELRHRVVHKPHTVAVSESRREVFVGGLSVLSAVVQSLGIERMSVASSALREGALADLVGRIQHEDIRTHTVDAWSARMEVDAAQAHRVVDTSLAFFDQAGPALGLLPRHRKLLGWAAQLHEVGQVISWSGYHKHGAYILQNAELPGFSLQERRLLAAIVLVHRGRFSPSRMRELAPGLSQRVVWLAVLLRLARDVHRGRSPEAVLPSLEVRDGELELVFQPGALAALPLLRADLEDECSVLGEAGVVFRAIERSG
jgi:exopolyphosphatase / guanosine-5'-triphosphate,3'-diphosphate pyrophosphatase